MKLPEILATLTQEPLIIIPSRQRALLSLLTEQRDLTKREGVDWCGSEIELAQAEIIDGIMHIPIGGPIGRGLGKFEKGAGAVDVQDIEDEIDNAENDANCRGILFHMDSPGGMYSGTPELADRIAQSHLTTVAYIPGMACSGCYWIASACDIIAATKSADIGNVGVYCYLLDYSEQFKAAGIKPDLITSGEFKGIGAPGIPINKAQRQHIQDRVTEMAQTFYSAVQSSRPDVKIEDLQGQCFKAPTALDKGFIDFIVSGLDEVIGMI